MDIQVDILNFNADGQGTGSGLVANRLLSNGFNVHSMRPYRERDASGNWASYITGLRMNAKGEVEEYKIRINADATLRKQEWIELDTAVQRVARERLQLVADLRSRGLTRALRNGLGKTVFESQRMTDPGVAQVGMNPQVPTTSDRPHFDLVGVPLPVISSGFTLGARELATSRNMGESIDTTLAEACSRRVAETAEKMHTGTAASFTYGGYTLYGIRNSPNRATATITAPTVSAWTPETLVNEAIDMRETLAVTHHHFGPFRIYVGPGWDKYLDRDYSVAGGNNQLQTLRQRLLAVRGFESIVTLDHLSTYDFILVEMSTETIRTVVGLDVTTIQWEGMGGMELNFLVMGILVPEIRADKNAHTGIIHGAPAG